MFNSNCPWEETPILRVWSGLAVLAKRKFSRPTPLFELRTVQPAAVTTPSRVTAVPIIASNSHPQIQHLYSLEPGQIDMSWQRIGLRVNGSWQITFHLPRKTSSRFPVRAPINPQARYPEILATIKPYVLTSFCKHVSFHKSSISTTTTVFLFIQTPDLLKNHRATF